MSSQVKSVKSYLIQVATNFFLQNHNISAKSTRLLKNSITYLACTVHVCRMTVATAAVNKQKNRPEIPGLSWSGVDAFESLY